MKKQTLLSFTAALLALFSTTAFSEEAKKEAPGLRSANVLTFAPDSTLFVGDSHAGKIYAFETKATENPAKEKSYNIYTLRKKLASLLGTTFDNILIKDLAIHPTSKEAYIAVSRITGDTYTPAIVIINQNGDARLFDTKTAKSTHTQLKNVPEKPFKFFRNKFDSQDLVITDIDYKDSKLYVSGVSTGDFASTLRVVDYPFSLDGQLNATIEIYHTTHDLMETRAPIRTMDIITLEEKDYILAAYTCTPLVLIPLEDIKDGAHIKGKTIAELGYGNTPIDFVSFTAQDMKQNKYDVVFLTNKNQAAQIITHKDILESSKKPRLNTVHLFKRGGTPAIDRPMTGILQIADQDPMRLATIRLNMDNGTTELVSFVKNACMRLSDYQSEYDFPAFKFTDNDLQNFVKGFQNMLKNEEGYSELVEK